MRRRIITVNEFMTMTEEELNTFINEDVKALNEGIGNINESNVDFQGRTIADIVKKYNCVPTADVFQRIRNKLGC